MPIAPTHLAPIDLAIVAAYLVAITLFGLRFSRRNKVQGKSLKSYFLADNTIPWWAISLSIVSAETSTLTIISIPGVAFAGDLGFLEVVLGYMLGRVVVALLFLPRYFKGEILTAYQLIDQRFGHALHKVTAGLFLLTRAAAEGVRVFAISIVVGIAIDVGDVKAIAIISALTLLYTFEGGMAAVIWTDVVQMALYVAGTLVALWTLGAHVPGGWQHIHAVAAPLGKFHWLNFAFNLTQSYTFWAGVLGGTFLTMASHGTDQLMVQRMLAARNLGESRLALLSSGVVIFLQFTLFLLIGVGLFVFYGLHPQVFASADRIFPTFIVHEMPHGIAGLLIAAILAAAMSNLSAALNSLASTTVIDFYVPLRLWQTKRAPGTRGARLDAAATIDEESRASRQNTLVSRVATVFWAIVLFAIAVYSIKAGGKGHVVETGLSIASVAYGCLLGVFLLGTLTRYATQGATIAGMIGGFALNLWLWQGTFPMHLGALTIPHIAFTWYVLIGAAATFLLGSLFSVAFRHRRAVAVAAVIVVSYSAASAQAPRPPRSAVASPDFSEVSTLINQAIAEKKLPGAVVLIGHDGKVVFEHAYGDRALEPRVEPMTEDTIFDMASLTKVVVTTTAILQLVDEHKIELDAPVAKYLPEFAQNGKEKITVRELLTHYSGLPPDVDLKDDWGLKAPDKAEGIRRAMASVPDGPPGLTFKYSDINFITLGYLVETIAGQPLDAYAQQHIFTPLGMSHTRYLPMNAACGAIALMPFGTKHGKTFGEAIEEPCSPPTTWRWNDWVPNIAPTAHDDQGTAATNPNYDHLLRGTVHDPTTRRMGGVAGHAGLFSTAHDMSLFCQALLDKLLHNTGPFPVSQATLKMAVSPNEPATAVSTATIFTPDGETTKGVASHGLGWDLNTAYSRPRGTIFPITTREHAGSFGHTGFTGTSLWIDPTCDTYVILLANAVHIPGAASISHLRGDVATAAAKALGLGKADPLTTLSQKSHFGAEDDSNGTIPLPESVRAQLEQDQWVKGAMLYHTPPLNTMPASWVRCYLVHLGAGDETDYVVAGAGPLMGANVTTFWVYRMMNGRPVLLMQAPELEVDLLSTRHHGLLDIQLSAATAVKLNGKVLRFDGTKYVEEESSSTALGTDATQTGIDVLESSNFAALKTLAASHGGHLKFGLLSNQSSRDANGKRTIDILYAATKSNPDLELKTLFAPEHGLAAHQDTEHLTAEADSATGLPVISVYGPKSSDKHPKQADLKQLDAVVIDLQDAGTRFWTYETLTGYFLEACAEAKIPVVILDRPNPLGGLAVQGPTSDVGQENYTDFMPLPLRHGLTLGELARYFNANAVQAQYKPELVDGRAVTLGDATADVRPAATRPGLHAEVIVVQMNHWTRAELWPQTGLTWMPPSPNLKSPAAAILYPGVGLTEQTNISVGRGTDMPFENLGAPWIDAHQLAGYLTARKIAGIEITPTQIAIADDANHYPFHGQTIPAIHFQVTDPEHFDSPAFGIELLAALHRLYPVQFKLDQVKNLLVHAATLAALRAGADPGNIIQSWSADIQSFEQARKPYLLYQ